jgi:hypothetical protein
MLLAAFSSRGEILGGCILIKERDSISCILIKRRDAIGCIGTHQAEGLLAASSSSLRPNTKNPATYLQENPPILH